MDGSGPRGRVVLSDIEQAPAARAERPPSPASGGAPPRPAPAPAARRPRPLPPRADLRDETLPLSPMRKAIARNLSASKPGAPHFYLETSADARRLVALREQLEELEQGSVSLNDLIVKAAAEALSRHPEVNAAWGADAIVRRGAVDVGIAVALDEGLVTPVVRDADRKDVFEIAAEIRDLAGRAREKKLAPEEYQGASFTISNLGMFGIEAFYAVINPPEAAILAVGAVQKVAWVDERRRARRDGAGAARALLRPPRRGRRDRRAVPPDAAARPRIARPARRHLIRSRPRAAGSPLARPGEREGDAGMAKRSGPRTRIEKDTMGEVRVPASALYGAQTARAVANFPISGLRAHPAFVDATVRVKLAAARANARLGLLPREKARAIEAAAREVLGGAHRDQFVVDVYQAGAGTSHNMNVNEVLANRADRAARRRAAARSGSSIPNDDVNMAQSTNDVVPTAIRLAALELAPAVVEALAALARTFEGKARRWDRIVKSGPDAPHGRDANPARAGGVGLGGRALGRGRAGPRRAPGALAARHRRHRRRHRAERPPALPRARGRPSSSG